MSLFFSRVFNFSLVFVRRTTFTFASLFWKYISRAHYFPLKYFPVVWHINLSLIAKAKISCFASAYFYTWHLQAPCTRFLYIFEGFLRIKVLYRFPHFTIVACIILTLVSYNLKHFQWLDLKQFLKCISPSCSKLPRSLQRARSRVLSCFFQSQFSNDSYHMLSWLLNSYLVILCILS